MLKKGTIWEYINIISYMQELSGKTDSVENEEGTLMIFGKKKSKNTYTYDKDRQKPVLKCSKCNGEQVAGLKEIKNNDIEGGLLCLLRL